MPRSETKKDEQYRLTGEQKFWLLFWCLILGSCAIGEFSHGDAHLLKITTACHDKSDTQ
jgi:hypothetical protein